MRRLLTMAMLGTTIGVSQAQVGVQDVEILDWLGITGITQDIPVGFESVRSGTLPYDVQFTRSYFPTSESPGGEISSFFGATPGAGSFELVSTWDGFVNQPAGDGASDGPLHAIAVLIRTTVPVTYTLEATASIGIGAGDPTNTPYATANLVEGFCFTPGQEPGVGGDLCDASGLPEVVSRFHWDLSGFSTGLDECCAGFPDVGETSGTLPPGEYSILVQSGAFMEPLFGPGGDGNGRTRILLEWDAPGCEPDLNGDGVLDLGDIQFFVALFLDGDAAADVNGDGVLDLGDVQAYVGLYQAGC